MAGSERSRAFHSGEGEAREFLEIMCLGSVEVEESILEVRRECRG